MADYDAGTAFVSIVPSFRNVQRLIGKEARQWGRDAGREYQQGFNEEVTRRPAPTPGPSPERSRRQGEESGGSFSDAFRKRLAAAAASLPPFRLTADVSETDFALRDLRAELAALSDARIGVDLDSAEALTRLEQVQARLQRLDSADADVQVRSDVVGALAQLAAVREAVDSLDGRDVDIDIDVRGGAAGLATLNSFSGRLVAIGLVAGSLAPALVPIGGIATAALVAIGAGATASLPAIGALALGLSGVGEAVGALAEQQDAAAEEAQTAARAQQAAAFQVESAQAGLASARAQQASSARSSARAVEDAATRVGDVEERTARDVATAQRAARTAREEASRAAVDAGRANAQAARALADAERTAEAAQADALRTQQAITEARREATRDLEDLRSRVAGGTLAERDAELALAEARQAAARTAADPDADRLDQQRATLSVAQAEQRLGQVRRDNGRAQEDLNAAQRAGVEGSRQVVAATEAAASADARRQQSGQAVADAEQAVVDTRLEGVRQVAQAEQVAADRQAALDLARADSVRARIEAQLALSDAQVAADEAQRSSTASVEAAQRALAQAFLATEQQASASAQKVADAFAGLSPAAAAFATFLFSLRGELDQLRDSASSALLPGLTEAIELLRPSLPAINAAVASFAGALGDLAVAAARALTGPAWEGFFSYMAAQGPGIFVDLARAVGGLALGLGNLMVAFAPLTDFVLDGLTRMMAGFAEWAGQLGGSDGFGAFLDYVRETGPQVGEFIGQLADAFVNIVRSMAPMGPVVLTVVGALASLIAAIPPGVLQFIATAVLGVVTAFSILGPLLRVLVPVVSAVMTALAGGSGILAALAAGVGVIISPLGLVIVGVVALTAALVAAWQHSETFRSVVQGAFAAVAAAGRFLWEQVLRPAFAGIVAAVRFAWENVLRPIFQAWVFMVRNFVAPVLVFLWRNVVQPAFAGIQAAVSVAWKILEVIFKALAAIVIVAGRAVIALYDEYVRPYMTLLAAVISAVWENDVKPVFQALGAFIADYVAPAFQAGLDVITAIWEGLRDAVKEPVRFVVETVINGGIIDTFNGFVDQLKLPDSLKVEHLKLPAGFRRGGVLPGQSRWQDGDDQLVPMRRGEGVYVSEAMRDPYERNRLFAVNAAAMSGHSLAPFQQGEGMATGGVAGLIAFGRRLRSAGFQVSENKALGDNPRPGSHSSTGWHYKADNSGAIDVNAGAGESDAEKRRLVPAVQEALRLGFGAQFLSSGHYNHAHFDAGNYRSVGDMSRYGGGSGEKGLLGTVVDALTSAADFLNPFDGVVDKLRDDVLAGPVGQAVAGLARRGLDAVKEKVTSLTGGLFDGEDDGFAGAPVGGGVERWRPTVLQALGILGLPATLADTTLRRMDQESGGNPRAINNWDINARNGIPSKGLMQVIDPTFRANAHPLYDQDVYDPLSNVLASMRYAIGRYGSLPRAYNRKGGYALGGVHDDGPATVGGWPFHGLQLRDSGGPLEPGITAVLNATGRTEEVLTPAERAAWRSSRAGGLSGPLELVGTLDLGDGLTGRVRGVVMQEMAAADNALADALGSRTGVG